ncbi:MAG: type III-A CRISPR-associated RAMP protein Csm5, partial [Verrucomicrobiota bacterium]
MVTVSNQSLSKPSEYETQTIRLTSRLLHIGSSVSQLNPFEYVQSGGYVYLPDQEALARSLRARGFLNDYVQYIEDRQDLTSLLEDALGNEWWTAPGADGEAIFPKKLRIRKWAEDRITDFRPMIRNGFGHHYIPGSSIKGAMRTAIAYYLLKHAKEHHVPDSQHPSAIERRLQQSMGELKRRAKFVDDQLFMDELFTNFSLVGHRGRLRTGPNTDFMRAIHIRDSDTLMERKVKRQGKPPVIKNHPVAAEVIVSSRFNDYRA